MKRRLFLQSAVVAPALMDGQSQSYVTQKRPSKGIKVKSQEDRFQQELQFMGGQFHCKVSAKDTNGQLCIYDTSRQEKGGPALHKHFSQDEWFYVIRGQFIIQVGEETFQAGPGDSVFAPRMVPHAFVKTGDGEAQLVVLFQPAGSMEQYFAEVKKISSGIPGAEQQNAMKDLWKKHGMEVVGPPLKF